MEDWFITVNWLNTAYFLALIRVALSNKLRPRSDVQKRYLHTRRGTDGGTAGVDVRPLSPIFMYQQIISQVIVPVIGLNPTALVRHRDHFGTPPLPGLINKVEKIRFCHVHLRGLSMIILADLPTYQQAIIRRHSTGVLMIPGCRHRS